MNRPTFIVTAGKGGTGKSTIAAHLVELLPRTGRKLVVDADPHAVLSSLLGHEDSPSLNALQQTDAAALESGFTLPAHITRRDRATTLAQRALLPLSENTDLLIMGRNRKPGCQCSVNSLLGSALDELATGYDYVLVDNEAGIEPIGRHAWPVDLLLLVATPRRYDLDVAAKVLLHAQDTGRTLHQVALLLNHARTDHDLTHAQATIHYPCYLLPQSPALADGQPPEHDWLNALRSTWQALFEQERG